MKDIEVYMVSSWGEYEQMLFISTDKNKAIDYAEDWYNRTEIHVWIIKRNINLIGFETYTTYDPDEVIWEKKEVD